MKIVLLQELIGLRLQGQATCIPRARMVPRAILLGMLRRERNLDVEAIARLSDGARFAPEPLSDEEHARLRAASLDGAPAHVLGDYPEWLDANFS